MIDSKTFYEQIPVEAVRKIAQDQEESQPTRGISKEHWIQLCEQASVEQDPQKLLVLVKEINELLEKKNGVSTKNSSL